MLHITKFRVSSLQVTENSRHGKGIFRTLSNIYDGVFLELLSQKMSIIDVLHDPKYDSEFHLSLDLSHLIMLD